MADRLYLSLWYPNFRLEALPAALTGVLRQFALVGGKRVSAASAYPINFTESPTYQRIYVDDRPAAPGSTVPTSIPPRVATDAALEAAVAEATEQLHDDMAYEFEMRWQLWAPEGPTVCLQPSRLRLQPRDRRGRLRAGRLHPRPPRFILEAAPHTVRILGFGPTFDVAGYEQNGHLLVDFGLDTPWIPDHPLSDLDADP